VSQQMTKKQTCLSLKYINYHLNIQKKQYSITLWVLLGTCISTREYCMYGGTVTECLFMDAWWMLVNGKRAKGVKDETIY